MVFEILKPVWLLYAGAILTVIMYSEVWSLVEKKRWSVRHHIVAVELFIRPESVTARQCGFLQQFQRCDILSHHTLLLWVSKWHQEGSVKDSKPQGCPLLTHKPDNVQHLRDAMLWSPQRSAWQQALTPHLNSEFAKFSTRICITIHTKSKMLRNFVNATRSDDYCFAMNSWTWSKQYQHSEHITNVRWGTWTSPVSSA